MLAWSCIKIWINPGIKFRFHEKSNSDYSSHTDMSSFNHLVTNDDITCQQKVVTKMPYQYYHAFRQVNQLPILGIIMHSLLPDLL